MVEEFPIVELTTGEVVDGVEQLAAAESVGELAAAGVETELTILEAMGKPEAVELADEIVTVVGVLEKAVVPLGGEAGLVEKEICSL